MPPLLFTTPESATKLKVKYSDLQNWMRAGIVTKPTRRVGAAVVWSEEDLARASEEIAVFRARRQRRGTSLAVNEGAAA
jgi:hypothetical protein